MKFASFTALLLASTASAAPGTKARVLSRRHRRRFPFLSEEETSLSCWEVNITGNKEYQTYGRYDLNISSYLCIFYVVVSFLRLSLQEYVKADKACSEAGEEEWDNWFT